MQKSHSTYLYKYKNSSNYFFRAREGIFDRLGYVKSGGYFVASLHTSDYEEARWLALFIKSRLTEITLMDKNVISNPVQNDNESLIGLGMVSKDEEHALLRQKHQRLRAMMQFRKALRVRFEELLKAGKAMIDYELESDISVPMPITEEKRLVFKQHCEENTPKALKVSLVDGLVPSFQNDNDGEAQFAACVSMLNTLMSKLNDFKEQRDDFALNDEIEHDIALETQQDVTSAVKLFENMRSSFDEHQRAEKLKKDEYFTLAYQAPLFLNEKKTEVAAKTFKKYERSFSLLLDHFPSGIDLRDFTKVQTQSVKDMLSNLDKHQNVGKSGGRLTPKTKNGMLSNYHSFFTWLSDNTDIKVPNPFSNVSFSKQKNAPKRRSFSNCEARKILSYDFGHGSEAREFRTDAHWYPKVALYSGMRLNELSALPLSHIRQDESGIWYFDLNGLDVKNEASERTVPIAQYLLDLGILRYIDGLRAKGEVFLFPQIRGGVDEPGSAGWGDPISRWFNRTMLKNIGIDSEAELAKRSLISFHSSRRTVISTCVVNGEEHYLIKRIVGHSVDDDITLSVYADMDQIPLAKLKEVLDKNLTWHKREVPMNNAIASTFRLFENWGITDEQKSSLLGIPQSVSLSKVPSEPDAFIAFSPDLKDRCILLLDIQVRLKELFSNPLNVNGYMMMPNENNPFVGSSPLELACSSYEGLKITQQAMTALANSVG
ncbi:hypothetical protein [Paraglaciecola sp.]|uniref:hypothetical protein n=1 Tax=Paraglaciecola sp. TaxID=1920173 RepID=UPI0032678BA3